jgi:DNA-binding transcriptional MocR family regulator
MKRYEALAELLATDIRSGKLAPGTKLPSIRKIMAQHEVSPSTAFQAYYLSSFVRSYFATHPKTYPGTRCFR